jgi:hypothetical protein
LSNIPPNARIAYGGLGRVTPGIYAIVESATVMDGPGDKTDLVIRLETDCTKANGKLVSMNFYLADVEAFVHPAMVVPDVGGPENSYLAILNRPEWRRQFERWLETSQEFDDLEDESSNEEDDTSDED